MKIACLGTQGTFVAGALAEFMKNKPEHEVVYVGTMQGAIDKLAQSVVDMVFCPRDDVSGGAGQVLDALAFSEGMFITGEWASTMKLSLLANKNTKDADVKAIFSHPQSISQCAGFLAERFPNVEMIQTASAASAAQMVAKSSSAAAIGGADLAEKFELVCLHESISDNQDDEARFITIERRASKPAKNAKTTIAFAVGEGSGELHKMLSVFNLFDVNLLSITSRPTKTVLGEYMFLVDIDGDNRDENIKEALEIIKKRALFFRNMGSYQRCDK